MDVKLETGNYIDDFLNNIAEGIDETFSDYIIERGLSEAAENCGIQKIYKNEQHTNINDTPGDECSLE